MADGVTENNKSQRQHIKIDAISTLAPILFLSINFEIEFYTLDNTDMTGHIRGYFENEKKEKTNQPITVRLVKSRCIRYTCDNDLNTLNHL